MTTPSMQLLRSSAMLLMLAWCTVNSAAGQLDPDGQGVLEKEASRRAGVEPAIGANWQSTPSIEVGVQVAGERDLFWGLSNTPVRNPYFDFNTVWYAFYAKPALGFKRNLSDGKELYARASAVASATVRHDPFGAGDTGRISIEEFVAGIRMPIGGTHARIFATDHVRPQRSSSGSFHLH